MNRRELFQRPLLLDGAAGTMFIKRGILGMGTPPPVLNLTHESDVERLHRDYVDAGAEIIIANTFGVNPKSFDGAGNSDFRNVITAGIRIAKRAAENHAAVALDVTSIGELLAPLGTLDFEQAVTVFSKSIKVGCEAGCDLIYIETMTDLNEMRAAILAAKETCDLPVIASMSFGEDGRTFTGCSLESMAVVLTGLGASAIGINCSVGMEKMLPLAEKLLNYTGLPVFIKPNAGLPINGQAEYSELPEDFFKYGKKLFDMGVSGVGGCCGSTPEHIAALKRARAAAKPKRRAYKEVLKVSSASKTVTVNGVCIVGERINPTGKPLMKEALIRGEYDYILRQASEQQNAGAMILDVNAGLNEIDEAAALEILAQKLGAFTTCPLQFDSSSKSAIERALRVYPGKAIVNSVNADEGNLEEILPIVKKYGAAVIGLTLSKKGLPKSAEERFALSERILRAAEQYGISKENVIIDCLTLTIAAEQEQCGETLKAISMIKKKLGLKTTLGVSNISFGLPERQSVNAAFLTLAMNAGLDLPIINPNLKSMTDCVYAYNTLTGADEGAVEYIRRMSSSLEKESVRGDDLTLHDCIVKGYKEVSGELCERELKDRDPLAAVNEILIPALDEVGKRYDSGAIFLPQLLQSAEAAKAAFAVIKKHMAKNGQIGEKGTVVVATVFGDIHDIGKNIAVTVMENYGYRIVDLGKNVPPEEIAAAVKKYDARLLGLSALMTTTVQSMEKTIRLIRKESPECKILVAGAVLTPEYAKIIGADYFAEDANQSVAIAKKVFGH